MFGLYMINDSFITPAGLGVLLGACALPSMFVPLVVGHSVDKTSKESYITIALYASETVGLTLLAAAVTFRSFALALVSLLAFGIGTSSLSVIQRVLVTLHIKVLQCQLTPVVCFCVVVTFSFFFPGAHHLHHRLLRCDVKHFQDARKDVRGSCRGKSLRQVCCPIPYFLLRYRSHFIPTKEQCIFRHWLAYGRW
jgi:hypothetical protein